MTLVFKKSPHSGWYVTVIDSVTNESSDYYPNLGDNFPYARLDTLDFFNIPYDEKGFTKLRVLEYFEGVI